ncbi:PREDICTED: kinesin-like protein KIF17 [Priapulus caudatus]|uniref:Kinesin-like protein n=1 Tax=Priapulus caudatus TaxID=37621 RepID=A0ABM1FAI9_PRICU|nr:PREDICTED: kinesin-like protein KIF17 [Priapulus caudatus]
MSTGETVQVIVRARPMNDREKKLKCKVVLEMDAVSCVITNPNDKTAPPKKFTFDAAYFTDSTTEQIYSDIGFPLVENVTGGIQWPCSRHGAGRAALLEIYIGRRFESAGKGPKNKSTSRCILTAGHYYKSGHKRGTGLTMHPVHNVRECEKVMQQGWKNRSTGSTLMNADSSRSHAIFAINLEMVTTDANDEEHIRAAKLNLVDLAGSERQAKTGATGERLKEATKINLSLSALGNVISSLVDGKATHIPYRDSKLTRLLQDSLGGNTKTLMIACLSPADNNYEETLSTLRYANRAKNIKNKPKINEDPKDALLRQYQEEIEKLKAMLTGQAPLPIDQSADHSQDIQREKERLQEEYEDKMSDMRVKYEKEQKSNVRLHEDIEKLRKQYDDKISLVKDKYKSEPEQVEATAQDGLGEKIVVKSLAGGYHSSTLSAIRDQSDALERLQELQNIMVGGERANDVELKEKRKKKKLVAEKKRQKLADTIQKMDDDGIMMNVYDSMQDELKAKSDMVDRLKKKLRNVESEVKDLQSEFEFDRTDYLDTIRRQDQQIKLLQQLLDKVQPCLRRDCNYSNLDKVKQECVWDEDAQRWRLPDLIIERTNLPPAGNQPWNRVMPGGKVSVTSLHGYHHSNGSISDPGEDSYYQKLESSKNEVFANDYFKPKRDLTQVYGRDSLSGRNIPHRETNFPVTNDWTNGTIGNGPQSSAGGAGNISTLDLPRKPVRLEALPMQRLLVNKKKKNRSNTDLTGPYTY